jgi:hypothetical protein
VIENKSQSTLDIVAKMTLWPSVAVGLGNIPFIIVMDMYIT